MKLTKKMAAAIIEMDDLAFGGNLQLSDDNIRAWDGLVVVAEKVAKIKTLATLATEKHSANP